MIKIKTGGVVTATPNAVLFLIDEQEVWVPRSLIKWWGGNKIAVPSWFAKEKHLRGKSFIHRPEKIEPVFDQGVINELKFDPEKCS